MSPESSKKKERKKENPLKKKKKKDYRLRKKDKGWRLVSLASAFAARLIAAFSTALIDTITGAAEAGGPGGHVPPHFLA